MAKLISSFFSLLFPLLATAQTQQVQVGLNNGRSTAHLKLFVFGDSYADTGNTIDTTISWRPPYGITYPGNPTGRFSDGLVFTDYVASFLGIESPVPYKRSIVGKSSEKWRVQYGVNYAHGGSGVFRAMAEPNMTTQIDYLEQQLAENKFTKLDLQSSMALVSLAGNDYAAYIYSKDKPQDLQAYSRSVVKQLSTNLKRIQVLGVPKIAVTALEPIGCVPQMAALFSYQNCSETWNSAAKFHNQILHQAVQKLNNENNNSNIVVLDLYEAFMSKLKKAGNVKMEDVLKPCCEGVSKEYYCGSVDENGAKKYVVCKKPEQSLFWDTIHPSQSGWHAVYLELQSSLHQLH